ncbi:hypothetical protein FSG42_004430 [Escherichia coli]|nr:hypothetical protein [Escherichia coli]
MKKVGGYTLPDNAKLAGIGQLGCYYYNSVGDIYRVSLIGGVQHFRLMHFELSALKKTVLMYEV